ncbi:hypothetical protein HA45_22525 [Pantoea rodasii]|nr:hypothetical protein HA45_22525 [Pantoea rodasii]
MNGTKTISGTLDIGLEVDGQLHRDFTLRLPTVGDEIDVADDESVPDSGYRVALMGRCMVTLGTLTPEKITFELLRQELNSDDFLQLVRAADELKKSARPRARAPRVPLRLPPPWLKWILRSRRPRP